MTSVKVTPDELTLFSKYISDISGIHLDSSKGYLLETRLVKLLKAAGADNFTDLYNKIRSDFSKKISPLLSSSLMVVISPALLTGSFNLVLIFKFPFLK